RDKRLRFGGQQGGAGGKGSSGEGSEVSIGFASSAPEAGVAATRVQVREVSEAAATIPSAERRDPGPGGGAHAVEKETGRGSDGSKPAGSQRAQRLRARREAYRQRQIQRDLELRDLRAAKEVLIGEVAAMKEGAAGARTERTGWLESEVDYLQ
ncbi:hypothetical protein HK405_014897, partial [Cladochytrium tenue]